MPRITINDKELSVPENMTVLDAARLNDIYIPTLCNHPKLTPSGGCRLCLVEIKGFPRPVASCTTPVTEGMDVSTSHAAGRGPQETGPRADHLRSSERLHDLPVDGRLHAAGACLCL